MLKSIASVCVVCFEHHIDILNAKSIGKEHLTSSSLSHLGFNKVQKEPPKVNAQSEIFHGKRIFGELAFR